MFPLTDLKHIDACSCNSVEKVVIHIWNKPWEGQKQGLQWTFPGGKWRISRYTSGILYAFWKNIGHEFIVCQLRLETADESHDYNVS